MFLAGFPRLHPASGILRACGDVSSCSAYSCLPLRYSPRMRRCFLILSDSVSPSLVFSAHAEMFPSSHRGQDGEGGILRACGDVSAASNLFGTYRKYSPRMRRCFRMMEEKPPSLSVFSAYAEMFLQGRSRALMSTGILRVCGDVSGYGAGTVLYSPRMRRCFYPCGRLRGRWVVFSAYAEMFPTSCRHPCHSPSILRVCGDVSCFIMQ